MTPVIRSKKLVNATNGQSMTGLDATKPESDNVEMLLMFKHAMLLHLRLLLWFILELKLVSTPAKTGITILKEPMLTGH